MPGKKDNRPLPSPDEINSHAFQCAFEAVPTGLIAIDPSGHIAFVNSAAEVLFSCERDQLQGRPIEALVPAARRAMHSANVAAFLKTPTGRAMGNGRDVIAIRGDGTEFPVEIRLSPLQTTEGTWVLAAVTDRTGWERRAPVDVRDHRAEAYLEAVSEGLITVDEAGTIEMVNKAAERIFGYDRSELLGQPLETVIPDAHRRTHMEKRALYFSDPKRRPMAMGLNLIGRRKNGTHFPAGVGLDVARIDGRTVAIAFVTDLTEKRWPQGPPTALEALANLQRGVSNAGTRLLHAGDTDPLTGLDTRVAFERSFERICDDTQRFYAVVYSIERLQQVNARFGVQMAGRVVSFVSQYVANTLQEEHDQLFRWDSATFVALIQRHGGLARVRDEVTAACGKRLEYVEEHGGSSSLLMIVLRVEVLPLAQCSLADAVGKIERVVRSVP